MTTDSRPPPTLAAHLLRLWEAGGGLPPAARDGALLRAAYPDADPDALAGIPLGRRDALLLQASRAAFGPRLDGLLECPDCGLRLQVTLDVATLAAAVEPVESEAATEAEAGWLVLAVDGYEVEHRLPTGDDLSAVTAFGPEQVDAARAALADRLIRVRRDGRALSPPEVPASVLAAALEAMAARDPGMELSVSGRCPDCGSDCGALVDAGALLWGRVEATAVDLLRQVDVLARAYGWSEPQILALSDRRRHAYLELIR